MKQIKTYYPNCGRETIYARFAPYYKYICTFKRKIQE